MQQVFNLHYTHHAHRGMHPTECCALAVNVHVPLTLVSVALVFRLYMALRAYIAERE